MTNVSSESLHVPMSMSFPVPVGSSSVECSEEANAAALVADSFAYF